MATKVDRVQEEAAPDAWNDIIKRDAACAGVEHYPEVVMADRTQ